MMCLVNWIGSKFYFKDANAKTTKEKLVNTTKVMFQKCTDQQGTFFCYFLVVEARYTKAEV